jgi:hypothetical protein
MVISRRRELRMSPFSGVLQACDDPAMLDQLAIDFANREREFWNSSLDNYWHYADYSRRAVCLKPPVVPSLGVIVRRKPASMMGASAILSIPSELLQPLLGLVQGFMVCAGLRSSSCL